MRKKLVEQLFIWSQYWYLKFFKKHKKPWRISREQLLAMSDDTFGHQMGLFLEKHQFDLIDKVERHDAYHVLTGYGTQAQDEVALQYVCFGNGKRTPYLFAVLMIGTFLLPEYFPYYLRSYKFGKNANSFHHYDFKEILPLPFESFRNIIFIHKTATS